MATNIAGSMSVTLSFSGSMEAVPVGIGGVITIDTDFVGGAGLVGVTTPFTRRGILTDALPVAA